MTHSDYIGRSAHEECWNLLPWIANETVAAKDLSRIEPHLRACKECQEELEFQRQLRTAIRSEDAIVLAPQTSLQKLMQRIDGVDEAIAVDAVATREQQPAAANVAVAPARPRLQWLPIAAAVQGIAITGLLTALWWQSREKLSEPRFTTLTTQASVVPGPVIRVVFASGTTLAEVGEIARSIHAQIVAGPSEAGVYTLGIATESAAAGGEVAHGAPGTTAAAAVELAIKRLRADRHVVFAESAITSEAQ